MFQDNAGKDVLLKLIAYTSQGNWSIVTWLILFTFLENGCNIGTPPVFRYSSGIKTLLEDDGEVRFYIMGQFLQYPSWK